MNREELTLEVQTIAQDVFQKPELILCDSLSAADVDTWTSLSFMQFLTAIEEKYGFKFKMLELLQLRNIGAIIESIQAHMA